MIIASKNPHKTNHGKICDGNETHFRGLALFKNTFCQMRKCYTIIMGIKDRLREIDHQEASRWSASYEDRERYIRLQAQYEKEFPEIRASQAQLLEEVIEETIPQLPQYDREKKGENQKNGRQE